MSVNDKKPLDRNELEEYREMIDELGTFPVRCLVAL